MDDRGGTFRIKAMSKAPANAVETPPEARQQSRRILRSALLHAALALGFLGVFVWQVAHR